MLPSVAIVGRPNVGKSTLFNQLTRSRDALVGDEPGLTRDRQYGIARHGKRRFIAIDTGGLADEDEPLAHLSAAQTRQAEVEADLILFMVDARAGMSPLDEQIAARLRRYGKHVAMLANKVDGLDPEIAVGEFHSLGLGTPWPIAARDGRGIAQAMDAALDVLPAPGTLPEPPTKGIRVAVIGRPNVGKSTLVNRILDADRVIAHEQPGTTRDSITIAFRRRGRDYTIIDTAGIRRRSRVDQAIEKFSIVKTLQAVDACEVAMVLLDAGEGVSEQDARLLGMVTEAGRALVIVVNKWDIPDRDGQRQIRRALDRKVRFADFADTRFVSALRGTGIDALFASIDTAHASATRDMETAVLTRTLMEAVTRHPPPIVHGRRIKLRYAHQGGINPPLIVVHGNQTQAVPTTYRRYLTRVFRDALSLHGTPVRVEFKTGDNPYQGRRNVLTPRQLRRRKRLVRHVRGKKR